MTWRVIGDGDSGIPPLIWRASDGSLERKQSGGQICVFVGDKDSGVEIESKQVQMWLRFCGFGTVVPARQ